MLNVGISLVFCLYLVNYWFALPLFSPLPFLSLRTESFFFSFLFSLAAEPDPKRLGLRKWIPHMGIARTKVDKTDIAETGARPLPTRGTVQIKFNYDLSEFLFSLSLNVLNYL